jgi:hypothetical protein
LGENPWGEVGGEAGRKLTADGGGLMAEKQVERPSSRGEGQLKKKLNACAVAQIWRSESEV